MPYYFQRGLLFPRYLEFRSIYAAVAYARSHGMSGVVRNRCDTIVYRIEAKS